MYKGIFAPTYYHEVIISKNVMVTDWVFQQQVILSLTWFCTFVNSVEWSMTSSAVRSSAGSRSKGGEEAIDISWDLKVMGYLCVSPYDIFRINENLGRRHRGKTVRLRRDMSRVVAWSRVGSPTTCQACRAALGSPLLLNQRHLRIYKNIKMLHALL